MFGACDKNGQSESRGGAESDVFPIFFMIRGYITMK
jgi:hypothetical protein